MQRLAAITSIFILLTGCAGDMGTLDEGDPGENIGTSKASAKVLTIANKMILATRPQATALLVNKLNLVLANNSIIDVKVHDIEGQILSPLTTQKPDTSCPYLSPASGNTTITCRYLVDRAVENALGDSPDLQQGIEQNVDNDHAGVLSLAETKYVKNWVGQAVLSGIDVGAIHTLVALRKTKVCDQAPSQQQSAFKLGEKQGRALLEQAEQEVIPVTPRTICNTDTIAASVLAAAQQKIASFVSKNAVCGEFKPGDLAQQVDLAQAEKNRRNGVTEGMRQGFEALRVRLVTSWVCIQPPEPNGGGGGEGGGNGDPLVVDLDGDGVKLATKTRVPFDLSATGNTVLMPALRGADALLVIDRDGDGRISDGSELFGNTTRCGAHVCPDGIAALAQHDVNKDGRIDAKDAVWSKLRLWRDANNDGKSSDDELSKPAAYRLRAITLTAKLTPWSDGKGNSALRSIGFEREDGSAGRIHDVWFSVSWTKAPSDVRAAGLASSLLD
jgi:hypothetical protein